MNPTYKFIFILCLVLPWFLTNAQSFYVNNSDGQLVLLNVNTGCTSNVLTSIGNGYTDIASHPDGFLYGIKGNSTVYRINVSTGTGTFLTSLTGSDDFFTSLTANAQGDLFAGSREGNLYSYNPASGVINYHGNMGFGSAGDLTYYESNLYMASDGNELVRIHPDNPSANFVFIDFSSVVNEEIWGIVSAVDGCDATTYATTGDNTSNFNSQIYLIDWDNQTIVYSCTSSHSIYGGASEYEFNASQGSITVDAIDYEEGDCINNTGGATVTATSINGSVSYSLDNSNFQNDGYFTGLPPGDYIIYMEDVVGCTFQTDITITLNTSLSIDAVNINNATCIGNDGSIVIEAISNSGGLSYSLDGVNFQGSNSFPNLAAGNYTVTVQDDDGCVATEDFSISVDINATINSVDLSNAICGEDNGSIQINASSNIGPVTYSIDGGANFQTENEFSNLPAGDYTIIISDANGCTLSNNYNIPFIPPFTLDNIVTENTSCGQNNGGIQINTTANGNTLSYSIDGNIYSDSNIFENIPSGNYTVSVIDENGCQEEDEVEIPLSYALELDDIIVTETGCLTQTGSITIEADGGPGIPILYQVNGIPNNTGIFENLGSGSYEINLSSGEGCELGPFTALIDDPCGIYIPNVFSPNGDRYNDKFTLYSPVEIEILTCKVFSRWGELVYERNNYLSSEFNNGWDGIFRGKEMNPGVFSYYFHINKNGEESILKGDVTLVR